MLEFEWGPEKGASNLEKHGVGFDEAATVFFDPLAALFEDEAHSDAERRELIIGSSHAGRLLIVSFTERPPRVRLISARQATPRERRDYEGHHGRP